MKKRFTHGKIAGRFASKLHGYSHLSFEDMKTLCQRGDVLTLVLEQALRKAASRCSSCKQTGRPANSRKISFARILGSFNKHVQLDFFFAKELDNIPILHIVDVHTGLSAAHLMPSREMTLSARALEVNWINIHGSPAVVSADPEFFNSRFAEALRYFNIQFQPRPARRHNKLGVVERKKSVVRTIIQRLLKDADYFHPSRDRKPEQEDILSRAVYLSNILYGSQSMSSFELARGYTPALVSLPQAKVPSKLLLAYNEQIARRALSLFQKSRVPVTLTAEDLTKNDAVYFFKRSAKFGLWESAYIRDCHPHFAVLSRKQDHAGKPIRAAYEDIRKAPSSPLLQELDRIDFIFPRSYSVVDEDYEDSEIPITADLPELYPELANNASNNSPNSTSPLTTRKPCQSQLLPNIPAPGAGNDHLDIDKEWSNWVAHSPSPTGSSVKSPIAITNRFRTSVCTS